jgi:hypothetical protein
VNLFGLLVTVALGVWFLITLLRKTEEERRSRERSASRSERPAPPPKKRLPPADIDRFLEEVNRRRRQAPEGQARPAPKPRPTPSGPATTGRVSRPAPTARPVPPATAARVAEAVVAVAVPASRATWADNQTPGPITAPALTQVTPRRQSEGLHLLFDLLRSPQSLRTAVLMKEILGPPRCRRSS